MTSKKRPTTADIVTLASPPLSVAPGEAIAGQYVIEQMYGSGPLGYTYRARDLKGNQVAVKVIARELCPTANERVNFVTEMTKLIGREMSRVAIPFDVGTDGGIAYVATQWIRGRSLRRVLGAYRDNGRVMPYDEVLGVLDAVVQSLRQLHTVTAHGALYPESVQIGVEGRVMLTDAGIAGALPRARLLEHVERFPDVMPYFAPEVRAGKASSAGADLYALGALASELLTGDAGAASAGISGPMLHKLPGEIDAALAGLVSGRLSSRASALPALLGGLAKCVGSRSVPVSATLPPARGRTDVMPTGPAVNATTRSRTRRRKDR